MNFSEIGVKSRKTGLRAPENVRRDAHGMEDLDKFFEEEDENSSTQPTSTSTIEHPTSQQQQQQQRSLTTSTSTSANGRLMFDNIPSSLQQSRKRTPLLSPLPSKDQLRSNITDDDRFDDALEHPAQRSSSAEMEIDDETRGSIKVVNNNVADGDFDISMGGGDDDYGMEDHHNLSPSIHHTPRPPPGQKLFVSDSEDDLDDQRNKTYQERQLELERNTTVRSTGRPTSRSGRDYMDRTPPRFETSPLNSLPNRLHSPLQPSTKVISTLSKSIATNKRGRPELRNEYDDDFDDGDAGYNQLLEGRNVDDDSDEQREENGQNEIDDDDNEDQIKTKARKRMAPPKKAIAKRATTTSISTKAKARRAPPPRRRIIQRTSDDDSGDDSDDAPYRGGRVNKFQRSTRRPPSKSRSPVRQREHHIDVDRLRHDQESRASSRHRTEMPTRRSSRVRIPPLAFWRNERPVYARSKNEEVPSLQQVVTVDEVIEAPRKSRAPSRARSRATSRARSKSRSRTSRAPSHSRSRIDNITEDEEVENEDEIAVGKGEVAGSEWMRTGFLKVDAYQGHGSEEKSHRLVAWGPNTQNYSSEIVTAEDNFKLAILFDTNREFIASGMMLIPSGGKKNMKSTDGTYFVFYCIQGIIQVTLSGSVFMIKKGCSLEVPMGNFYEFINVGKKDATLFFVQTKGQEVEDWDDDF